MTQDAPSITLSLSQQQNTITGQTQCEYVQVGTHAFITLLSFSSEEAFISGCPVHYALHFHDEALQAKWQKECQALLYPRQQHLNFVYWAFTLVQKPAVGLHHLEVWTTSYDLIYLSVGVSRKES